MTSDTEELPRTAPLTRAWYREAYVWLLIALPAAAFLAGLATVVIALHGADTELPRQ